MVACSVCKQTKCNAGLIICNSCGKTYHLDCLASGRPSPIEGDIFFAFTCGQCHSSGQEFLKRIKLPWLTVVHLALYNLQLHGGGKFGFFKWKESIIAYIDKHWQHFFPGDRKKASWFGTVAGTLSNWSPQFFLSGSATIGEPGWWKLTTNKPPCMDQVLQSTKPVAKGKSVYKEPTISSVVVDGGRSCRTKVSSIQAAIELKARRDQTFEAKEIKKRKLHEKSVKEKSTIQPAVKPKLVSLLQLSTLPLKVGTASDNCYSEEAKEIKKRKLHEKSVKEKSTIQPAVKPKLVSLLQLSTLPLKVGTASDNCYSEVVLPSLDKPVNVETATTAKKAAFYSESVSDILGDKESDSDMEIDPCSLSPLLESEVERSTLGVKSLVNTEQEKTQFSQEWDQIMAPFCDTLELGSDVTKIKEEPTEKDENDTLENVSNSYLTCVPQKQDAMEKSNTFITDIKQDTCSETTENDNVEMGNIQYTHLSVNIKKEIEQDSRPNSAQGFSSAESERETIVSNDISQPQSVTEPDYEEETSSECSFMQSQRRKRKKEEVYGDNKQDTTKIKHTAMSLYEEKQLLQRLQSVESQVSKDPEAKRLKRKLLLRELKREHGLPCFDIDSMMNRLAGQRSQLYGVHINTTQDSDLPKSSFQLSPHKTSDIRILDRFQTSHSIRRHAMGVSFLNKLVGSDEEQLQCIRSPYTARLLKPFIRRDYESRPKKMKLLMEIQSYPHRNDPSWTTPNPPPIDYCYVQPQHIPSVNSFCREFFWPGIDLSECLQYPDFSCVVLYRKFVIGFAFMVPDVKHNEAYISFIFTHPEWRGAGIAKFMVYHLIQTCMGKDITLHVSASNSAMLLYQKFGFKPEEFILDFYDKYFPVDSKESRHAFFLRLRR